MLLYFHVLHIQLQRQPPEPPSPLAAAAPPPPPEDGEDNDPPQANWAGLKHGNPKMDGL